jgi:hypothetical protein
MTPLMIVAINVACGAGNLFVPIPCASAAVANALSRNWIVNPITIVETTTPMTSPICWRIGVAPTRKPVFKSWLVAPAFAAAMHTIAPTHSASG